MKTLNAEFELTLSKMKLSRIEIVQRPAGVCPGWHPNKTKGTAPTAAAQAIFLMM
jgi:hypothetical protein